MERSEENFSRDTALKKKKKKKQKLNL